MKRRYFLILLIPFFASCTDHKDIVVAEAFNHKLYSSEVVQNIPSGLSVEDSLMFYEKFIDYWLMERVLIQTANDGLKITEKDFQRKLQKYKDQLILEAYYEKITKDTTLFNISEAELRHFVGEFKESEPIQKNVVKVNYVKLSKKSPLGNRIKDILFDDVRRISEKNTIIKLCGDSIEYFVDDNQWLSLDYIENDFPFDIKDKNQVLSSKKQIDISDYQYRYIVIFLDFKNQIAPTETLEELNSSILMLKQHKKTKYLNHIRDSLYQKAILEGHIIK